MDELEPFKGVSRRDQQEGKREDFGTEIEYVAIRLKDGTEFRADGAYVERAEIESISDPVTFWLEGYPEMVPGGRHGLVRFTITFLAPGVDLRGE